MIGTLIIYFAFIRPHNDLKVHGTYLVYPEKLPVFELSDHHGQRLTNGDFYDHWTLVFFGFTHCPMICPVTLSTLNTAIDRLKKILPKDQIPQVVFITVDPAQDTTERLKTYISAFNPDFIGARADLAKIINLEEQLHLPVAKDNVTNHSMEVILINPKAEAQAYFTYPPRASDLVTDYLRILKKYKP